MSSRSAQLSQEPAQAARRGVREQIALNRRAVGHADDATANGTMNAARWGRHGVLQRLRRHAQLSAVA
jgi:hypothetical protein